jgi:hypothetical protein
MRHIKRNHLPLRTITARIENGERRDPIAREGLLNAYGGQERSL